MKATGIVRRIDDLGRIVIPKEIRRNLRIREGDPLEIFTGNEGEVIFKKYSPVGELASFSSSYAEILNKACLLPVVITDRDHVTAVYGVSKKEYLERRISSALENIIESRKFFIADEKNAEVVNPVEGISNYALIIYPIISSGDIIGSVILMADPEAKRSFDISDIKLIKTAAAFLGKQTEE